MSNMDLSEVAPARLAPPGLPRLVVTRRDLIERLDTALTRRVVLLVAGPGAGKSVLLAQWARHRPDRRVAWLVVDDADDDAARFAAHLVGAVRVAAPSFPTTALQRRSSDSLGLGVEFCEAFAAAVGEIGDLVLVIQDFERLRNDAVLRDLSTLIGWLPASARVVIASRERPTGLLLGRLDIAGEIARFTDDDLRFDQGTTQSLLASSLGHLPEASETSAVLALTEGWAAGVAMVAQSLRDRPGRRVTLEAFAGERPRLTELLTGEVIAALPDELRSFAIETSVLDRMCARVCDAVRGRQDSQRLLHELQLRCALVAPTPEDAGWVRNHQLLREALLVELHRVASADEIASYHVRAAQWFEARRDVVAAGDHYLAAEAWKELHRLLREHGSLLYERGENGTALRWYEALPDALSSGDPITMLSRAGFYSSAGRVRTGDTIMRRVLSGPDAPWYGPLIGALGYAIGVQRGRDLEQALDFARSASEMLTELPAELVWPDIVGLGASTKRAALASARVAEARCLRYLGDAATAAAVLDDRVIEHGRSGGARWGDVALGVRAMAELDIADLAAAERHARHCVTAACSDDGRPHRACAEAHLALARLALARLELEALEPHLSIVIYEARRTSRWYLLAEALVVAADAAMLTDPARCCEIVESFRVDGPPPLPRSLERALQALAHLGAARAQRGRSATVTATANPAAPAAGSAATVGIESLLDADARLARFWVALEHDDVPAAERALAAAALDGRVLVNTVVVAVAGAVLANAKGDRAGAVALMERAIDGAQPRGLRWPFAAGGAAAAAVLGAVRGDRQAFAADLVARLPAEAATPASPLLSRRELDVLRELRRPATVADIAEVLFVSQNTVKTHLRNIYVKLGVDNRRAAVRLAERLGLIPTM